MGSGNGASDGGKVRVLVHTRQGSLFYGLSLNAKPPSSAEEWVTIEDVWSVHCKSHQGIDEKGQPQFMALIHVSAPYALSNSLESITVARSEIVGWLHCTGATLRQLEELKNITMHDLQAHRAGQAGIVLPARAE